MNPRLKLGLAVAFFLLALGIVYFGYFRRVPSPGGDVAAMIVCPNGHRIPTDWGYINDQTKNGQAFVESTPDNKYLQKIKCPTCGAWADIGGPEGQAPGTRTPQPAAH